ncbi:MAG: biopolymer transporter ExbD [Bdellovibrionaceae bacterium]|nr:biopolymer transporter ExbD [Pseudobdellovibrionaceae bacterium]
MGMNTSSKKSRVVLSEINVTPLVDVMLVLLVVFMITAPMMQQGIDINLPKTATAGIEARSEPLVVTIKSNNAIFIGEAKVPLTSLGTKIKGIFKTRADKQVYIKADKKVDYGIVAEVIADIKAAGIESVGLVTLPK